jgi:hypothetical protein
MGIFDNKESAKTKEEKMTREQAFLKIENWINETRSKAYGESLLELQDIIWVAVADERLVLDENEKLKFIYVLEDPITSKNDGSAVLSMVHMKSQTMKKIFEIEKCKSTSEKSYKMIESFCTNSDGEEIPIGNIMSLNPRDSIIIQAVISAFFF